MHLAIDHNGDKLLVFHPTATPAPLVDYPGVPITFACVVATHRGKVLFVFNPRRAEWELPAGIIEAGETALQTAQRELQEESGQVCSGLVCAGMALLHLERRQMLELGAIFTGELDTLRDFAANTETSDLMLWDLDSPVQGQVNAVGRKLAKLIMG